MKKYFFAFLLIVVCFSEIVAQDTLYKKNGDIIITKILEVNPLNIQYKYFKFLEGPVYTIDKSELFMIRYQNGLKDLFLTEQTKSEDDYAKDNKVKSQNN